MGKWRVSGICLLSLITIFGHVVGADEGRQPFEISLLHGTLTPPADVGESERQAVLELANDRGSAGGRRIHLLVQLHHVPNESQVFELATKGLELSEWASGSAFIASVETNRVAEVIELPEIRWYRPWSPELRIHPRLAARDVAPWARDPERPDWVAVFVQLHREVSIDMGTDIARQVGGVAMTPVAGLHGLTMWVPDEALSQLSQIEDVLWVEEAPAPLSGTNDGVRAAMNAEVLYSAPYDLDGSGVRVFVFDSGSVRTTHETFDAGSGSRVIDIDGTDDQHHATHVAGTAAGDGSGSDGGRARGVAPGATVLSAGYEQVLGAMLFWDNAGDIEADYATARIGHDADLGTNSIGSNTASNDFPCDRMGDYGVSSSLVDGIVRGDNTAVGSPVAMTWAAGNERTGGVLSPGRCGTTYATTSPPGCAKNPIHVGAINSDGGSMTAFSSWGPCDDGRLKPLLVAAGCATGMVSSDSHVYSAANFDDSSYGFICGTSQATPGVAGGLALFLQRWRAAGHGGAGDRPLPALLKAMAIHTATDLGATGPDFTSGYGNFDIKAMIDLMDRDDGALDGGRTAEWGIRSISQGETHTFTVIVPPGSGSLRASTAWDDAAAPAFVTTALVNDLDIELESPSQVVFRPWVLDPAAPDQAATFGVNSFDNQEQVVVTSPEPGTWIVRITGTTVPVGPQSFGLTYSADPAVYDPTSCATTHATFETGADGFVLDGSARVAAPAPGHGDFSLLLGDEVDSTHEAYLEISIPSDTARTDARFAWYMTTDEWSFGHPWDYFSLQIRDSSGTTLSVTTLRSDGLTESSWLQIENIDLTPWTGQTIRLTFQATNDQVSPTSFFVDDVAVTSCDEASMFNDGFETGDLSGWSSSVP